jgi:hypothetical protein
MATSVVSVGFLRCCENKRRTAAGGMFARRDSSAFVKPSSFSRTSKERTTSSNMAMRRDAVS